MTDDRAALAAAVALALDLEDMPTLDPNWPRVWISGDDSPSLRPDGSNLFTPEWIWRCVEWLRTKGDVWIYGERSVSRGAQHEFIYSVGKRLNEMLRIDCPAAEFPARAIAALMQKGEGCDK